MRPTPHSRRGAGGTKTRPKPGSRTHATPSVVTPAVPTARADGSALRKLSRSCTAAATNISRTSANQAMTSDNGPPNIFIRVKGPMQQARTNGLSLDQTRRVF